MKLYLRFIYLPVVDFFEFPPNPFVHNFLASYKSFCYELPLPRYEHELCQTSISDLWKALEKETND